MDLLTVAATNHIARAFFVNRAWAGQNILYHGFEATKVAKRCEVECEVLLQDKPRHHDRQHDGILPRMLKHILEMSCAKAPESAPA